MSGDEVVADNRKLKRGGKNSRALRPAYWVWIAFPYFLRRPLTSLGIAAILGMKRVVGTNRRTSLTPLKKLDVLSFWGVPEVDAANYRLEVTGLLENSLSLTLGDIRQLPEVERTTHMDCVGGSRNIWTMRGVTLQEIFDRAVVSEDAESVVFRCADGYYTTHLLSDLGEYDAFLAYEIAGEDIRELGIPLRLAVPGTYGYKWAKWVTSIEVVAGFPAGYWDRLGLPKRGRVGDIW